MSITDVLVSLRYRITKLRTTLINTKDLTDEMRADLESRIDEIESLLSYFGDRNKTLA